MTERPALPQYPVILLPLPLQDALSGQPQRERFAEPEPELPVWNMPFVLQITVALLRLFGRGTQADQKIQQARQPLLDAHQTQKQLHQERKAAFETQENHKFTPEALLDYRRKRTLTLLESSVPEVGREGFAPLGFAEDHFLEHLQHHFESRIGRHFQVSKAGHSKGFEYVPDFVYFDPRFELRICIEVDEPYSSNRTAIHHVEFSEVTGQWESIDAARDQHFLDLGWGVVRFSEEQVIRDPEGCCRTLQDVIEHITLEHLEGLHAVSPVTAHPRWDRQTANQWGETGYRERYQQGIQGSRQIKNSVKSFIPDPEPSEHQQAIYQFVREGKGHGLVLAVAGSGKSTTLLTVAQEVLQQNPQASVLMLAFNKTIQQELQEKAQQRGLDQLEVKTLNSFGLSVLRRHFEGISSEGTWKRYGGYLTRSLKARYAGNFEQDRKTLLKLLSLCKSYLLDFRNLLEVSRIAEQYRIDFKTVQDLHPILVEVMEWGLQQVQKTQKVDFDDQCWLPVHLDLSIQPYDFVLIDECQDLTQMQLEMVQRSVKAAGRLLFVGDVAQAIMGFRGADHNSVNNIRQLSPTELSLSVCYRCPSSHLEKARTLMPLVQAAPGAKVGTVQEIPWHHLPSHAGPGDLMFGRTKATVRQALYQLVRNGRKINFLQNRGTQDPLQGEGSREDSGGDTLLNAIDNLMTAAQNIAQHRQRSGLPYGDELSSHLTRLSASKTSGEDYLQLRALHGLYQSRDFLQPEDFLEFLKHQLTPDPRGIMLCTAHQAKGLEAERVFVLAHEEFNVKDPSLLDWEQQQEKNLWYVALTRSRKELYLVRGIKA
ncbi:UvrD-helicase domain-containing protein [Deinococcus roseus]|uniref:DNA 3'-5' helicase n=1 Tax=Deinococcus roseus TaxID=392414 RepID=A0ABQ2CWZ5_9DEIO|nr:UvrD-helicase domain-containing protein [Deinococcus roseus]GGJ29128.1 hypothetical protein GCM10008938_14090 [Deinococcus roseus]